MELDPPLALWAGPKSPSQGSEPSFQRRKRGRQGTLALSFPEPPVPEGRAVWASQFMASSLMRPLDSVNLRKSWGGCIRVGLVRTRDRQYLRESQDPWNSWGWGDLCGEQGTPDIQAPGPVLLPMDPSWPFLPRKHNDDPHGSRHPAFISVADCRSAGGYRPLPPGTALLPYKDRETRFSHFQEKGGQRLGGEATEC